MDWLISAKPKRRAQLTVLGMSEMPNTAKVVINLATGLEDAERATIAFLVGGAAVEQGKQVAMFLTKEAVRLALPGVAQGVACDGCPALPTLVAQYADAGGRMLVCPVCINARKLSASELIDGAQLSEQRLRQRLQQHEQSAATMLEEHESLADEGYLSEDYPQREPSRQFLSHPTYPTPYGQTTPTGSLGQGSSTGPLGYPNGTPVVHTGNTGHMPAINASGSNTIVQSTVVQSTVDLNMLMDIIETVFDRPTISTFVLMTGDKDFTRISARLKLRLNKTVIVVGIPGTVSRDLISSANQFVPLIPGGNPAFGGTGQMADTGYGQMSMSGNTGSMPAISAGGQGMSPSPYNASSAYPMDVLDPQFLQFLDYIDRNWSWRTIIGVSNFIGDPVNPKNRFRGRLTRESARELLNTCVQQGILLLQTDPSGSEDLRLNRLHPGVDEVLKQFVR